MTTSPSTFSLFKPSGKEKIPAGTLEFVRAQLQNDLHVLVLRAFRESGISQADLAHRLGARPEVINRKLGASGNWTLKTVSDLLYAINGSFVEVSARHDQAVPNHHAKPDWLTFSDDDEAEIVDFNQWARKGTATRDNVHLDVVGQ